MRMGFPTSRSASPQGVDPADATDVAIDRLETVIGELIKKGRPLPVAKKHRGKNYRPVSLPALS